MLCNFLPYVPQGLQQMCSFSDRQVLKINVTAYGLFKLEFKILASLAWQLEVHTAEFDVLI